MKELTGTINENKPITKELHTIRIKAEEKITFKPGQFLLVSVEGEEKNKPYSIANAPWEEEITLCIKRAGENSNKLCDTKPGDKIIMKGPFGNFILTEGEEETNLFIAAGSGIAPIRSMIRTLFEKTLNETGKDTEKETILILGSKTEEEIPYNEEFKELAEKNNKFKYYPVISREEKEEYLKGHVQEHLKEIIKEKNKEKIKAYVCGMPIMVRETKEELERIGIRKENIKSEGY